MSDSDLWIYDYGRCSVPVGGAGGLRHGVLGIDEAGRGSWVGPVVAAAAYILPDAYADERLRGGCHLINDSKKLSRAEREALFEVIANWQTLGLLRVAAGQADVAEIEAHNIVGATALAMRRAVEVLALPCVLPTGACIKVGGKRPQKTVSFTTGATQGDLFDAALSASASGGAASTAGSGKRALAAGGGGIAATVSGEGAATAQGAATAPGAAIVQSAAAAPGGNITLAAEGESAFVKNIFPPHVLVDGIPMAKRLPFAHEGIVSGDGTSLAIAIASIWAKVTRDRLLTQLAEEYPLYGWAGNAGYGTQAHIKALRAHGSCSHHRMGFLLKQGLGGSGCST